MISKKHEALKLPEDRAKNIERSLEAEDGCISVGGLAIRTGQLQRCLLPAMCGCPKCVEKYGPIHPGNIGKPRHYSPCPPDISRLA
jgi:hypothetical protein